MQRKSHWRQIKDNEDERILTPFATYRKRMGIPNLILKIVHHLTHAYVLEMVYEKGVNCPSYFIT